MKGKKVAVLLHGLGPNGIDTLFKNLSKFWSDKVEVYYFIAVDEASHQFWEDEVKTTRVNVIKLHDLNKGRLKIWPKTLYKALKTYGPFDAIHTNMDMLNGINLLVAKCAGVKIRIAHAHRSSSETQNSSVSQLISQIYRNFMRLLMRTISTNKLACSEVAGDYFFGKNNYTLLFNCIDFTDNDKYEDSEFEKKLENNKHVFITVGRMNQQKNPLKLVKIWNEILKNEPSSHLIWIGEGSLKKEIKELCTKLNLQHSVSFIGNTPNVSYYLKQSKYFLLPSLFEGLSLALAEAQAYGLTAFVSDTCSPLSDCGKCVFIPLNNSPERWANEIINFIKKDKELELNKELMDRFEGLKLAQNLESIYTGKK